jgi:hypothetical protein
MAMVSCTQGIGINMKPFRVQCARSRFCATSLGGAWPETAEPERREQSGQVAQRRSSPQDPSSFPKGNLDFDRESLVTKCPIVCIPKGPEVWGEMLYIARICLEDTQSYMPNDPLIAGNGFLTPWRCLIVFVVYTYISNSQSILHRRTRRPHP